MHSRCEVWAITCGFDIVLHVAHTTIRAVSFTKKTKSVVFSYSFSILGVSSQIMVVTITRDVATMLVSRWAHFVYGGPTLNQYTGVTSCVFRSLPGFDHFQT